MRPRLRTDWDRDLNERHALETDVANTIANHAGYTLEHNNTASLNECDYQHRLVRTPARNPPDGPVHHR